MGQINEMLMAANKWNVNGLANPEAELNMKNHSLNVIMLTKACWEQVFVRRDNQNYACTLYKM